MGINNQPSRRHVRFYLGKLSKISGSLNLKLFSYFFRTVNIILYNMFIASPD